MDDLVMFLRGRVATNDGTRLPHDVLVERVCYNGVRQQLYASPQGDFSMQLGSRADSFLDASGDRASQSGVARKDTDMGIPRRELLNCELRASASGFHSSVIGLMEFTAPDRNIDVGVIVVQRAAKIEGLTLSATPYKAPRDASRAYEKGVEAERNGKLADARKYFEQAVKVYPRYAIAWFQLGTVLQKEEQNDAARKAYIQATIMDTKFLPPYLSLALMAYRAENWTEVLELTGHILDLNPLNQAAATGYILDLDPLNYTEAYFYNAVANYKLNKIEDAEKSALKAEHLDLRTRFPHVHLLLAEIFARKNNYAMAILEIKTYLDLAPHAKDVDHVREQLAKLEKLNGSVSTSEKPDQM
ncbi:MAG TPA: tetratricopeptide repeat protein [Candidatus Polarisedimenticolia bacterium]|nr:tetratricopeptide repeat protein [Candidatus Polarisedimenticolia bacterium]